MNTFPTHINTYAGGLDKDTSVNKYSNTHYQHAENFRILTDNGLTSGALQTISGTTKLFEIPTNYSYHGHCFIRDWVVLFLRHTGTDDQIYYFPLDDPTIAAYVLDAGYLVCTNDFNFQANYLVQAEGRYESATTQKVYFVDGYNNIRFVNLVEPGISARPVEYFDILPVLSQVPITIDDITQNGVLKSGLIEYATIFYTPKGSETVFSQPTPQIQIANGNLSSSFIDSYGPSSGVNTDKAVTLTITNPDATLFSRVRLISIHYQTYSANPIISIVGEYSITTSITIKDNGTAAIGEYSVEEFNRLKNIFSAATLSTKNNYLFAGNITEDFVTVDYDARSYRFNKTNTAHIEGSQTHVTIDDADIIADPDNWTVPLVHDAINPYTDLTSDATSIDGSIYDYRFRRMLLTDWTNVDYDTFTSSGATISVAQNAAGTASAESNTFDLEVGDIVTVDLTLVKNSGEDPILDLMRGAVLANTYTLAVGSNIRTYTITTAGVYHYKLNNTAASDFEITSADLYMFGGEGPNVSYKFRVDSFIEDEAIDANNEDSLITDTPDDCFVQRYKGPGVATDPDLNGTFDNYLSPYRTMKSLSFKRDEIYRVGVEWFDKYGRQLFVDWIGDIRFPANADPGYDFVSIDYGAETVTMHPLTLKVSVKVTTELKTKEIAGFRIVRCDRTDDNKTILDTGLVGSMMEHVDSIANAYSFPLDQVCGDLGQFTTSGLTGAGFTLANPLSTTYKEYTSADVNYNKNNVNLAGSYLVPEYNMDYYYSAVYNGAADRPNDMINNKKYTILDTAGFTRENLFSIDETVLFSDMSYDASNGATAYYKTVNGERIYNCSEGARSDADNDEARGTCLILHGDLGGDITNNPYDILESYQAVYSARKRNIVPYGGNSYYDRINSQYIPCSPYYDITAEVAGNYVDALATGDTYLYMHEALRTMVSQKPGATNSYSLEVLLYPTESSYNGTLRQGSPVYKNFTINRQEIVLMHETIGVYLDTPLSYSQTFDYYGYNKIYNQSDSVKQYLIEPLDFDLINSESYDNKVIASERKINNEYIDSWTQFYFANEIELDTKYGAISKLINFNNNLLSFQSKAIASLAVEEKEVAQTNTPTALAIGYSGVLSRYDYLSTENGSSQLKAIVQTPNQVMWYDDINNGIYSLKGLGEPSITKVKGVSSWFNNTAVSPDYPTYCVAGYDRKFNEVLFQFQYYSTGNYTLVFNEITDSFISLYSLPRIAAFIFSKSKLLGIDSDQDIVYEHNTDTSSLYGVYPMAKLSLIIKPQDPGVLRFDSLEWESLLETFAGVETQLTFDRIKCSNSYQDSGLIVTPDFKRRFRTWRYNTIRDAGTSARLRDTYMKLDFEYDMEASKYLLVHDIKTHCLPNRS